MTPRRGINGFPSVQYRTVCVFLINFLEKFTKPNAERGLGQKFLRGMISSGGTGIRQAPA